MAKLNFTKAAIEALPMPAKGWAYHYDAKTRGLAVGVGSTGIRSFLLYRKVNGKPERVTLGRYPDLTIEQARAKASEANAAIAKGENPADTRRTARAELTLRGLFAEYLDRYAIPHDIKTVADMRDNFRRYLDPWKNRKVSSITDTEVQRLITKLGKEIGPHTANRTLELLRAVINRGIKWKLCRQPNPAIGIEKFRLQSRERFLHADELPRFFQAIAEEPNDTLRDFVLLSLLTGARRANVLAMRWDEISIERAEWRIPETKNGTAQTVVLSPEALAILTTRPRAGEWVFPGDGATGHLVSPKKGWASLLKRADIADLRLHDLRRTLGSWQAKQGASMAIIGKSLNHKSHAATAIYARLDLDPVRASVEQATSALFAAARLKPAADVVSLDEKRKTG